MSIRKNISKNSKRNKNRPASKQVRTSIQVQSTGIMKLCSVLKKKNWQQTQYQEVIDLIGKEELIVDVQCIYSIEGNVSKVYQNLKGLDDDTSTYFETNTGGFLPNLKAIVEKIRGYWDSEEYNDKQPKKIEELVIEPVRSILELLKKNMKACLGSNTTYLSWRNLLSIIFIIA